MKLEISDRPDPGDIKTLENGLNDSVPKDVPDRRYEQLGIFLKDQSGRVVAGLEAGTYWEWLYIRMLWVDEGLRGNGIGRDLVKKAEEIARKRGCRAAVLDTFSFQAYEFYKKLDYSEFGTLEDYPAGYRRSYFSKIL